MWGILYLLRLNEQGITFGEQGCEFSMKTSSTRIRGLASGAVVPLPKGGGRLAVDDASIDVIRYLGGGVYCLIRGSRGGACFETGSAEFYGITVDEDGTCSS